LFFLFRSFLDHSTATDIYLAALVEQYDDEERLNAARSYMAVLEIMENYCKQAVFREEMLKVRKF
jgi:hypothetical protein